MYIDQKREDLAEEEIEQANVLEIYLPKQLSEEELSKELKNIIDSLGASSMSDIGRVMGNGNGFIKRESRWELDFQNHQRATELNGFFGSLK
jgi:uncharacterized protein YqeY